MHGREGRGCLVQADRLTVIVEGLTGRNDSLKEVKIDPSETNIEK
jgi:hypothetical protein